MSVPSPAIGQTEPVVNAPLELAKANFYDQHPDENWDDLPGWSRQERILAAATALYLAVEKERARW